METSLVINKLEVSQYINATRSVGRNYVSKCQMQKIADLYKPLNFEPLNSSLPSQWKLWERFLWCENYRNHEPKHNYTAYTFTPLYDYYFSLTGHNDYWASSKSCRLLIDSLLIDWLDYERQAIDLDSLGRYRKTDFYRALVERRVNKLERLSKFCDRNIRSLKTEYCALEGREANSFIMEKSPLFGVVELSGLPCSAYHDEYMFLRSVQISECYFYILGVGVENALNHYKEGNKLQAA